MKNIDIERISSRHNKILAAIFLIFLFVFANLMPLFAVENKYNNQLLKLNIDKSSKDKINITVTTTKPYKIKLSPMKRDENEYVILLPDTYHSITTKPDISKVSDLQDIDVKLIPYIGSQNNNNGYTKITVRTKSNNTRLNINDEVLGQKPSINSELSKLISQSTLKPPTPISIKKKTSVLVNKIAENNIIQKKDTIQSNKVEKVPVKKLTNAYKPQLTSIKSTKSTQTAIPVEESNINIPKEEIKQEVVNSKPITPVPPKNLQPVAVSASTLSFKKETPQVKKQAKSDNSSIKLVLISLIALLVLFIIVIKYFKSLLMKQMKQAEKNIIANKPETNLPPKPQEIVKPKQNASPPISIPKKQPNKTIPPQTPVAPVKNQARATNNNIRLIKGFEIEDNKGLYLLQTKYNKILIGIIDSEVFLLKEFNNMNEVKFIVRKEKALRTKNIYYVQINNWRSLISVAKENIQLELILDKTLITR